MFLPHATTIRLSARQKAVCTNVVFRVIFLLLIFVAFHADTSGNL